MSIGTWLYTLIYGKRVGTDAFGNHYYASTVSEGAHIGRKNAERRWVRYRGRPEPSKIPSGWHAWLHHVRLDAPTKEEQEMWYEWEKPHLPNLTGTTLAYRPPGDALSTGKRDRATGDYQPWIPS